MALNFEPNTDFTNAERLVSLNVAKAKNVDSITTLVNGESAVFEVYAGPLSYGQGYLLQSDGSKIPFSQTGASVRYKKPVAIGKATDLAGVSADIETSISVSYFFNGENAVGYHAGWFGKLYYGAINLAYGNSLDEISQLQLVKNKK